jgi:uncharacterized membrane protein HdeD (DUF308 family)
MTGLKEGTIVTDPNMSDPQGRPEYGAYGQNQHDRNQGDAQTPHYFGDPYGNPYAGGPNQGQGGWQPMSPFRLVEEWLPQQAKNAIRGVYGVLGVVAIILGLALLIWPGATLEVAAIALGVYFVVSGVIRIVTAIVELGLPGGWRVLDILVGVLLAVGGVIVLKNAALSGTTLAVLVTMVVGLGWMMEGVMALVESWRMPSSGWAVVYALVSIVAGFVVLFSPVSSTAWLILFGSCALIVLGVVAIVRAFTFGKPRRK